MAQARRGRPEMTKRQQIYYELYMRNCSPDLYERLANRVLDHLDKLVYDRFQMVYHRIREKHRGDYDIIKYYIVDLFVEICKDLYWEIKDFLPDEEVPWHPYEEPT